MRTETITITFTYDDNNTDSAINVDLSNLSGMYMSDLYWALEKKCREEDFVCYIESAYGEDAVNNFTDEDYTFLVDLFYNEKFYSQIVVEEDELMGYCLEKLEEKKKGEVQ